MISLIVFTDKFFSLLQTSRLMSNLLQNVYLSLFKIIINKQYNSTSPFFTYLVIRHHFWERTPPITTGQDTGLHG